MGIAGFFQWLQRNYRPSIEPFGDPIADAQDQQLPAPNPEAQPQPEGSFESNGGGAADEEGMTKTDSEQPAEGAAGAGAAAGGKKPRREWKRLGPPPVFDNLYLDMNGLIHPCCHDTAPLPEPASEEEMFDRIFKMVDKMVAIAKPRKVLVLAVDGVAPRSKMNQQRARRFRAATERQENLEIAKEMAEAVRDLHNLPVPPMTERWDHNVITPSTPFMERVGQLLEWYVLKRLNSGDPLWKDLTVVLSDAHVPGEGEHKIMHYIRSLRVAEDYDATTHHCIFGMDADLICLGLVTHELNFTVLRNALDQETKQPLHDRYCTFSLRRFRQLLQRDFANLGPGVSFERVVDDFVFLCFFIGNDFLPHMPLVDIKQRGIETLLDHYVRTFENGNYLTKGGEILFGRLARFLETFVEQRYAELLELRDEKAAYTERSRQHMTSRIEAINKDLRALLREVGDESISGGGAGGAADNNSNGDDDGTASVRSQQQSKSRNVAGGGVGEHGQPMEKLSKVGAQVFQCYVQTAKEQRRFCGGVYPLPFRYGDGHYREAYYNCKFGFEIPSDLTHDEVFPAQGGGGGADNGGSSAPAADGSKQPHGKHGDSRKTSKQARDSRARFEAEVARACREYLRGMQWVMRYYTVGCPSWEWYYPYHFAPLLEDVARYCSDVNVEMRLGEPLNPVHQLLAVLPQESYLALPAELHQHALSNKSPLAPFYPDHIEVDFTESTFSYQGVIKLPFMDVEGLKKATATVFRAVPDEGCALVFVRDDSAVNEALRQLLLGGGKKIGRRAKKRAAQQQDAKKAVGEDDGAGTAAAAAGSANAAAADKDEENNKAAAGNKDDESAEPVLSTRMLAINRTVTSIVPLAGRVGRFEYMWPINEVVECPDRGFAEYSPDKEGVPVEANHVIAYKYEMNLHAPYLPQMLAREFNNNNGNNNGNNNNRAQEGNTNNAVAHHHHHHHHHHTQHHHHGGGGNVNNFNNDQHHQRHGGGGGGGGGHHHHQHPPHQQQHHNNQRGGGNGGNHRMAGRRHDRSG